MKTKTVGTLLIAGLVVLSAMVVFAGITVAQEDRNAKEVFARTEAAFTKSGESADKGDEVEDPIMVYGTITDGNGDGIVGATVEIKKEDFVGVRVVVFVTWPKWYIYDYRQ